MPMESLQRGASVDSFKVCKVSKIPLPQFLTQGLSSSQCFSFLRPASTGRSGQNVTD